MDYYTASPAVQRIIDNLEYEIRHLRRDTEILEGKLKEAQQEKDSLSFRIRNELEPRLRQEQKSYDAWVATDSSAEGWEHWQALLDEMVAMVEDNPAWFDWETQTGNLDERILYLIKHQDEAVVIPGPEYTKLKENK